MTNLACSPSNEVHLPSHVTLVHNHVAGSEEISVGLQGKHPKEGGVTVLEQRNLLTKPVTMLYFTFMNAQDQFRPGVTNLFTTEGHIAIFSSHGGPHVFAVGGKCHVYYLKAERDHRFAQSVKAFLLKIHCEIAKNGTS